MLLPGFAEDALRKTRAAFRWHANDRKTWLTPKFREIAARRKADLALSFGRQKFGRIGQRIQYETLYAAYSVIARELDERAAASVGVEVRLPFWNTAMVQFAFSTPERLRLRGRTPKVLHRRAMAGLLPGNVLERRDKADFLVTFRRHADELRSARSEDIRAEQYQWVSEPRLDEMYNAVGNPAGDSGSEWMLWSFFGWRALTSCVRN